MNLYEFKTKLEKMMEESFDRLIQTELSLPPLPTIDSVEFDNELEQSAVELIRQTSKQLGASGTNYMQGVFYAWFDSKQSAEDFAVFLDANASVEDYDIQVVSTTEIDTEKEYDFDEIEDSEKIGFEVFVHLIPEIVSYEPEEIQESVEDPNGQIYEVRRVVRINSRGKRRIKMQCNPGYRWNPSKRTCEKIGGAELARKRLAIRKAIRTKKSKGAVYRARVVRKIRRARKFRRSFGLN